MPTSAPAPLVAVLPPPPPPPPAPPPAPSALDETMSFDIAYSLLGKLGELQLWFVHPEEGVRAVAVGKSHVLGGSFEKRVESHLDPHHPGATRRWVTTRVQSGKTVTDTIVQSAPGTVQLVRRRAGKPDMNERFQRNRPVLDPLGFVFALRSHLPSAPATYEVLDGRALWILALQPVRTTALDGKPALAIAGHADPVYWDGSPDKDREARDFTLWLSADALHTPLRLVVPMDVGEVRVSLARIDRTQPAARPTPVRAALGSPAALAAAAALLQP